MPDPITWSLSLQSSKGAKITANASYPAERTIKDQVAVPVGTSSSIKLADAGSIVLLVVNPSAVSDPPPPLAPVAPAAGAGAPAAPVAPAAGAPVAPAAGAGAPAAPVAPAPVGYVTYAVNDGTTWRVLEAPLVLIGSGAIDLLAVSGNPLTALKFHNDLKNTDVSIDILVGYVVSAPTPARILSTTPDPTPTAPELKTPKKPTAADNPS